MVGDSDSQAEAGGVYWLKDVNKYSIIQSQRIGHQRVCSPETRSGVRPGSSSSSWSEKLWPADGSFLDLLFFLWFLPFGEAGKLFSASLA